MATRFYLSTDTTGVVNVTGVTPAAGSTSASRLLTTVQPGAAAYSVSVTALSSTDSISTTTALAGWAWQALNTPVALNVSSANASIQLSVAVARVNSSGVVQVQGAFTAEQTATLGALTFTATSPSWGTPTSTDRLALVVRARNTSPTGSNSVSFIVGATHYVDAPIQQGLVLPTGTAVASTAGTAVVTTAVAVAVSGASLSLALGDETTVRYSPPGGIPLTLPPGAIAPQEMLDPLRYPWSDPASLTPLESLVGWSVATVTDVPGGGNFTTVPVTGTALTSAAGTLQMPANATVVPTGETLAATSGSVMWTGYPQFAVLATRVAPWRWIKWRPRTRGAQSTGPVARSITLTVSGADLSSTIGSIANFGAQRATLAVRQIPWWQFRLWRAARRVATPSPQRALTKSTTITVAGFDLTVTFGYLPIGAAAAAVTGQRLAAWRWRTQWPWRIPVRTQVAPFVQLPQGASATAVVTGLASTVTLGTVTVARISNITALPTGAGIAAGMGTSTIRGHATTVATGAALTFAQGAPVGISVRTVVPVGQSIATSAGSVTPQGTSGGAVAGGGLTLTVGTVTVQSTRVVQITGQSVGSAVGVALARFPVQAPTVTGAGLTAHVSTPLALATVPLMQDAASLYGPFNADQWFGVGSS